MQDKSKTKAQLIEELRQLRAEAVTLTGNRAEENVSAFHEVLEDSLNEIYFIDAQTLKFIQVNYGARLNLGYSQDELEKLTPVDIKPEFTHESFLKLIDPLVTGKKKKIRFTTVHQRKDGSLYPVEINLQSSLFQSHKVFIAIVLDITKRRQAEEALAEQQAQYDEAQRIAHLGHWTLDLLNNDLVWSDENYRIFGAEPGAENTYQTFLKIVHPDDYAFVDRAYTESVKNHTPYDIEHRLMMQDGSIKWVNERCKTYYDDDGTPLRSIGTTLDITGRKQAEALLKKSERQMKSIFTAANDAIFIVDPSNDKIVDANPKAAELLGYSVDDLKGMPMSAVHPDEMDQLSDFANEVFKQGRGFTNELHCKTKSGAILPAEISASSLQLGDQLLMLAIVRDITERKQAEEKIREMAYHDHLTGLPNRALFYDRLEQGLAHAHRNRKLTALLALDLDHFKSINDKLGHEWGDQALIKVGKRLLQCVRATDTVARLGGDEFSIILVDVASEEAACKIAEKVIAAIGQPLSLKKSQYTLGVSIGIHLVSPGDGDMENIINRADSAMYQAKKEGKNCYRISEQSLS